jgi:hypothetical protein
MSVIDDVYLINLLEISIENFKNELIRHKVSNINCNFIEFVIYKSPKNIKYLDEYYKYFNDIDINIIKNTRNSQDELLVDFYRNINTEQMDINIINHISFFLKTHEITNNILDLFSDNFIPNNQSFIKKNVNNLNKIDDNSDNSNNSENDLLYQLRCDIYKNKEDIIGIKNDINYILKEIETMKNIMHLKFDKLCNE